MRDLSILVRNDYRTPHRIFCLMAIVALLLVSQPAVAAPPILSDLLVDPLTSSVGSGNQTVTISFRVDDPDGDLDPTKTKIILKFEDGTKQKIKPVGDEDGRISETVVIDTAVAQTVKIVIKAKDLEGIKAKLKSTISILSASTIAFDEAVSFVSGIYPIDIALGDLDGDGSLDIITADFDDGTISVLLGDGVGGFDFPQTFASGAFNGPRSFDLRDLNGDGILDLAVANSASDGVFVLLGTDQGTFSPAVAFDAGTKPVSIAVGDINGDGLPDLVTVSGEKGNDNVTILLGNGEGGFTDGGIATTGRDDPRRDTAHGIAMGDLNGDANPDLAVAGSFGLVPLLWSDDAGMFTVANEIPAGMEPYFVAIDDLNADDQPDLVVVNKLSNDVSVLLGDDLGALTSVGSFAVGEAPKYVAVGDLDGDGHPDLATTNSTSNDVSVLLGDGLGAFTLAATLAVGVTPRAVAIGDLNGDGKPDLVTADWSTNNVSVILQQ